MSDLVVFSQMIDNRKNRKDTFIYTQMTFSGRFIGKENIDNSAVVNLYET